MESNLKYTPFYVNYPSSYESDFKIYVHCTLIKPTKQKYYLKWTETKITTHEDGNITKEVFIKFNEDYIYPPSRTESISLTL